jgi:4-carboxymuconolactone decarboxylase
MIVLNPADRTAKGLKLQAELAGAPAPDATTLMQQSWRDFIYAEVWSRPGLDTRSRFFIAMAGAATAGHAHAAAVYAKGALSTGNATLGELREAALHIATYSGWTAGSIFDSEISKIAAALGLAEPELPPICAAPWDAQERHQRGSASFKEHMLFNGPPPQTAYFEAGILNFVFGEMWCRPGLDERARRWLTLVGVGMSGAVIPTGSHVWSAMASGNASKDEMLEFVLQYAVHAGWPRGSVMQSAVLEQAKHVEAGMTFDGKPRS